MNQDIFMDFNQFLYHNNILDKLVWKSRPFYLHNKQKLTRTFVARITHFLLGFSIWVSMDEYFMDYLEIFWNSNEYIVDFSVLECLHASIFIYTMETVITTIDFFLAKSCVFVVEHSLSLWLFTIFLYAVIGTIVKWCYWSKYTFCCSCGVKIQDDA